MARRATTSAVLASGGKLPVLALQREQSDAATLRRHLERSNRLDVSVVRPADIVRRPLRWPHDARVVPLALCVLFRDRPGTVASAERLVSHVGDVPVIAVLDVADRADRTAELAAELAATGVADVVDVDHLNGHVLEQIVVAAIDRAVPGVLQLGEPMTLRTPVGLSPLR